MTAAFAVDSRAANENRYHCLRADFEAAYRNMTASSRAFNAVLMDVTAGLSEDERRARNEVAAQSYHDAHQGFLMAVRMLHDFMIAQIVSSHSVHPPAVTTRR